MARPWLIVALVMGPLVEVLVRSAAATAARSACDTVQVTTPSPCMWCARSKRITLPFVTEPK